MIHKQSLEMKVKRVAMTLLNPTVKIGKKFNFSLVVNESKTYKDFSIEKLKKIISPEYLPLIHFMEEHKDLSYKYHTIDLKLQLLNPGQSTCKDPSLHYDGEIENPNTYHLLVIGEGRTLFDKSKPNLILENTRQINHKIINNNHTPHLWQIPAATMIQYNSLNLHKGQVVDKQTTRILARLCSSNYIKPKNVIF